MSAQPKPLMHSPVMTMATNMRRMVAFADAIPICAIVSTLSAKSWRYLAQRRLSVDHRLGSGDFDPTSDKIKVMTTKISKDLGFPVVALPGVGHMPAKGEDEREGARVFYVAATRATQRLMMGVGGDKGFGRKFAHLKETNIDSH